MNPFDRYIQIARGQEHLAQESCLEFERFLQSASVNVPSAIIRALFALILLGILTLSLK